MEGMTEGTKLEKKHLINLEMNIAKEKMKIDKERVKIAKEEVKKEKEVAPEKGKSKTEAERDQQRKEGCQGLKSMLVIQGGGRIRKRSIVSVSRISSFIISPICQINFSCVLFLYNNCKPQS